MKSTKPVNNLLKAGMGNALIGLGLCITIEAGFAKYDQALLTEWVVMGTIGLVVTMSGINVTIDAGSRKTPS